MFKYEKIEDDDKLPIKLIRFLGDNNEPIEKHWHNSIEIVVPIKGNGLAWIDGEIHKISGGGSILRR